MKLIRTLLVFGIGVTVGVAVSAPEKFETVKTQVTDWCEKTFKGKTDSETTPSTSDKTSGSEAESTPSESSNSTVPSGK